MSNLLKKISIAALVFVAVVGVSVSVLPTAIGQTTSTTSTTTTTVSTSFTRNLTIGSVGADVSALQAILIQGGYLHIAAPTGYFGLLTKAAVASWQLAAGLPSTGFFGPLSRARLNAVVVYPAGCSSNAGFSTVNGQSCTVTVTTTTYPAGCTSSAGFSPTTGVSCATPVAPLPAGCTSTVGFSPTTGQSCASTTSTSTTTTTTTTNTTTTNNGAGSLADASFISSVSNEDVGEGENDVKVLGLDLEADNGSDLSLLAARVEFDMNTTGHTGSDNLDDYADEVSVWLGSTQVGSADVNDFDENNGVWSRTITLSNAAINAGAIGKLYVAVSSLSNIDSDDLGSANNDWRVAVTSVRYKDAQGAVIVDDSTGDIGILGTDERDFQFESFASSANVELKLTEASNNPDAMVVEVDDTDSTDGVVLLSGTLKALGSDIHINEMTVSVNSSGTGDASEIASGFILEIDGDEIQSVNSNDCTNGTQCDGTGSSTAALYNFDDVDFDLDENDSVSWRLLADINDVDGTIFVQGDSLTASVDNDTTDAEDANGDDLATADKTGTIAGAAQAFYSNGIRVAVGTHTTDITVQDGPASTDPDNVTFTWAITVSAFGDNDVYINADAADVVCSTATGGCASDGSITTDVDTLYNIEVSGGADLTANSGVISDTSDATLVTGAAGYTGAPYSTGTPAPETFFKIVAGTSESFTITVTATNATNSKLVRGLLTNIEWTADEVSNASATGAATINSYTFDLDNSSPTPWKTID